MNAQKENSNLLIGRVAMIFFFLFFLFAINSSDRALDHRPDSSSLKKSVSNLGNSAVLVETNAYPNFNNALIACELISHCNSDHPCFRLRCSNAKTDVLFRIVTEKFLIVKSHLVAIPMPHISSSIPDDDFPLISS